MIDMETELRHEDTIRLRKQFGGSGQDVGMPPPIKIVAGNKCDLKDARKIGAREGLEYARKHGCGFMETSAREMVNIEETFALLVRRVVEARRQHYEEGELMAGPRATGSSTAQTPALTKAEKEQGVKSNTRKRNSRVLGFVKGVRKRGGKGKEIDVSTKEAQQDTAESTAKERKSLWRRMRCC
ncbi:hypothetical protein AWENTII_012291 [Aspergillus wentii]